MKRTAINPVDWGLNFHMNQAEVVEGLSKVMHCSGQVALTPDANTEMGLAVAHPGDMRGQIQSALGALDAILEGAGMTRANVLSLRFFTTDIDAFLANYDVYVGWIAPSNTMPPQTLLGISRLVMPDLLIEIEATAGA